MQKKFISTIICLLCLFLASTGYSAPAGSDLEQGIRQYSAENYDEAIDLLEKARQADPQSAVAAFYLGMAYKQTMEYDKALTHLDAATKLSPTVKEAVSEYVSVLYQLNRLDEAGQRISQARRDSIDPANITYWNGMVLARKNQCEEAIPQLEEAKKLNPKLAQSADYAIGLCHLNKQQLEKAKDRFKAAVAYDPASDLAANSRRYQEMIDESLFPSRPLRVTLGLYGGYDSNLILKPRNDAFAPGIDNPGSAFFRPSLRVEFSPRFTGPWLFSALYSINASYNQKYVHTQDAMSQTVAVMPGYNFGRFSVSALASFTGYLLRTDPDVIPDEQANLKRYLEYGTAGAIFKILATQNNILELFLGYDKKEFYNQNLTIADNNRDAIGPRAYASWTWFYWDKGFLSLRYDYSEDRTDGLYWDNKMHRLSGNINVPLLPASVTQKVGYLYLQAGGGCVLQNYTYDQPFLDEGFIAKSEKRKDRIYNASIGLNWDIIRNVGLILQYKYIRSDSNIPIYTYDDHIYTAGVEFKF
ncbi:MAG: tetratricopeptide repeat protein [Deltaproteobacteria bacterium]